MQHLVGFRDFYQMVKFAVVLLMILKFVILVDFARNELFLDGFCLTSIVTSKFQDSEKTISPSHCHPS